MQGRETPARRVSACQVPTEVPQVTVNDSFNLWQRPQLRSVSCRLFLTREHGLARIAAGALPFTITWCRLPTFPRWLCRVSWTQAPSKGAKTTRMDHTFWYVVRSRSSCRDVFSSCRPTLLCTGRVYRSISGNTCKTMQLLFSLLPGINRWFTQKKKKKGKMQLLQLVQALNTLSFITVRCPYNRVQRSYIIGSQFKFPPFTQARMRNYKPWQTFNIDWWSACDTCISIPEHPFRPFVDQTLRDIQLDWSRGPLNTLEGVIWKWSTVDHVQLGKSVASI